MSDWNGTERDWQREATAWRARAEHLQATVDRLRSLAVAGESAGFLAHELNNLFTPVVGYCQAAQVAGADEVMKRKALEKSLAAAEKVGELAGAILQLAGTAGPEGVVGGESEVGEAVRSALMVLGVERWGREGVEVVVNVPRGTFVGAGAGVVQQVVMNLALNARRAMSGRVGKIEIGAREVAGMVRMEVRDGGRGMNAEVMGRVFGIKASDEAGRADQCGSRRGGERFEVDVQELARSGSINGQARWGVRVKEGARREARGASGGAEEKVQRSTFNVQIGSDANAVAGSNPRAPSPGRGAAPASLHGGVSAAADQVNKKVDRLRGAKIAASASPIRVWDAEEVAEELRAGDVRRETAGVRGGREENVRRSTFGVQMEGGGSVRSAECGVPSKQALKHGAHGVHGAKESGRSAAGNGGEETGVRGGTGLGLALCLELVARAGGRMWGESEVGVGTVVSVEWPRAERASARVAA